MKINRIILTIIALLISAPLTFAQKNKAERDSWLKEMTRYKHEFMAKELGLSADQQKAFFPLYDAMDAETRKIAEETRSLAHSVNEKGDKASDLEREKAAQALFELKGKENAVEMRYFEKFKTVLSSKQLLKIKNAERKFNRKILSEHGKHKNHKNHKK